MIDWPGHAVLQLPVSSFEPWVRSRWEIHDPDLVSREPDHVHAHVTLLGPLSRCPKRRDCAAIARWAESASPIMMTFDDVAAFPDGTVYAPAQPTGVLREWSAALRARLPWARCNPPHDAFVPHVTLEHNSTMSVADVAAAVSAAAVTERVSSLDLVWYRREETRRLHRWELSR